MRAALNVRGRIVRECTVCELPFPYLFFYLVLVSLLAVCGVVERAVLLLSLLLIVALHNLSNMQGGGNAKGTKHKQKKLDYGLMSNRLPSWDPFLLSPSFPPFLLSAKRISSKHLLQPYHTWIHNHTWIHSFCLSIFFVCPKLIQSVHIGFCAGLVFVHCKKESLSLFELFVV